MRTTISALALASLGCAQMAADVAGLDAAKAAADATQAAPAMKVFTAHRGYETFSPRFEVQYVTTTGATASVPLTPAVYGRIEGPYNRRNAYGAALAYAPLLVEAEETRGIVPSVLRYGFCTPGPLVEELALADIDRARPLAVVIVPRAELAPSRTLRFEVDCND